MTTNEQKLQEMLSFKDKTVIVTGAAVGIGKSICERLAEAGADLILIDINEKKLLETSKELGSYNVKIIPKIMDLSQKSQIDNFWLQIKNISPDILINNAGIYPIKDFLEIDEVFFDKVYSINLKAAVWMSQNFIKTRINRGGVIINISSIEAILPFKKEMVHYDISKTGIIGLTRALAKDYSEKGFRINAIIPGGIITPGTKNVAFELLKGNIGLAKTGLEFRSRLPMGRPGEPDEVAKVAIFLASELSSYLTGTFIVVDGGFLSA
ncbi:SDR family oxidoreductase [Candidatus Bathyarchaeota archaeon]|nr:SDR family oxidoreductase [Candidatus Bathyarchaeota archaeon]